MGKEPFCRTFSALFMARQGRPELIKSDNAAQLKLVKTIIDEQWRQLTRDEEFVNYLSNNGFTTALAL